MLFSHIFSGWNGNVLLNNSRVRVTVTCEVWHSHVLDGDLLQEGWLLTARVSTDHPGLLQPLTQPGQVTVAHIRVGQEVTVKDGRTSQMSSAATQLRDEHRFRTFGFHTFSATQYKTCIQDRSKLLFTEQFSECLCSDKSTWMLCSRIYFGWETCIIMWILEKSRRIGERENKKRKVISSFYSIDRIHERWWAGGSEGGSEKVWKRGKVIWTVSLVDQFSLHLASFVAPLI